MKLNIIFQDAAAPTEKVTDPTDMPAELCKWIWWRGNEFSSRHSFELFRQIDFAQSKLGKSSPELLIGQLVRDTHL